MLHKVLIIDHMYTYKTVGLLQVVVDWLLLMQELSVNLTQLWDDESSELRGMLESHVVPHHRLNSRNFYNNLRLNTINSQSINFNVLHSVNSALHCITTTICSLMCFTFNTTPF